MKLQLPKLVYDPYVNHQYPYFSFKFRYIKVVWLPYKLWRRR